MTPELFLQTVKRAFPGSSPKLEDVKNYYWKEGYGDPRKGCYALDLRAESHATAHVVKIRYLAPEPGHKYALWSVNDGGSLQHSLEEARDERRKRLINDIETARRELLAFDQLSSPEYGGL